MRKLYFLLVLSVCFIHTKAQDSVAFTPSVSANGFVNFINTTVLHGDGTRKAYWIFGDGTMQMTPPLVGTQHQYTGASVFTACLKIYKYPPNNPNDSIL